MNTKSYQIYIYQIVNNLGFKQKKTNFFKFVFDNYVFNKPIK
jgi:hypothetical protein